MTVIFFFFIVVAFSFWVAIITIFFFTITFFSFLWVKFMFKVKLKGWDFMRWWIMWGVVWWRVMWVMFKSEWIEVMELVVVGSFWSGNT